MALSHVAFGERLRRRDEALKSVNEVEPPPTDVQANPASKPTGNGAPQLANVSK